MNVEKFLKIKIERTLFTNYRNVITLYVSKSIFNNIHFRLIRDYSIFEEFPQIFHNFKIKYKHCMNIRYKTYKNTCMMCLYGSVIQIKIYHKIDISYIHQ